MAQIAKYEEGSMKKYNKILLTTIILVFSSAANAGVPVPEIDGAGMYIALGIIVSVAALLREKFKK